MRTTLDIADDVLLAAKERARHEGKTAGEILSELARYALTRAAPSMPGTANTIEEPKAVYGFRPFASRGGIVTNELINRLREDDAY